MKTHVPSYYKNFKCIADKCKHNCCIGWEICIDDETLAKYEELDRKLNAGILSNVTTKDDVAHFILTDGDRCPNLLKNNLCRLICDFGEDALCDICREHPRYRNYFGSREESGLGLSCEEAAKIILSYPEKVTFHPLSGEMDGSVTDEGCEEFLRDRNEAISFLQDRSLCIDERLKKLTGHLDTKLPYSSLSDWCDFFLSLEQLNEKWTEILEKLKSRGIKHITDVSYLKNELAAEQILVYFIHRHYSYEDEGSNITDVFKFAHLSCAVIFAVAEIMCEETGNYFEALCEAARMYSSEIEYSTENTDEVLFEVSF